MWKNGLENTGTLAKNGVENTGALIRNGAEGLGGIVTKISSDISGKEIVERGIVYIENRDYTEAGKLLNSGKLGVTGYIAHGIFSGILENQKLSQQSHHEVKVLLCGIYKEVVENEKIFMAQITKIDENRLKVIQEITKENRIMVQELWKELKENQASTHPVPKEVMVEMVKLSKSVSSDNMELSKSLASIDPNFISECKKASENIVNNITTMMTKICDTEQQGLEKMFDTAKDICFKFADIAFSKSSEKPSMAPDHLNHSVKAEEVSDKSDTNNQTKALTSGIGTFQDEAKGLAKRIFVKCKLLGKCAYQEDKYLQVIETELQNSQALAKLSGKLSDPEAKNQFAIEIANRIIADSSQNSLEVQDYHFEDAIDNFQKLSSANVPSLHK